jgi:hypothetical protein
VLELAYTLLKTTHLGEYSGVRPTDVPEKRLRHKTVLHDERPAVLTRKRPSGIVLCGVRGSSGSHLKPPRSIVTDPLSAVSSQVKRLLGRAFCYEVGRIVRRMTKSAE